ncbi:MAG: AsmA family protein [Saprospiraceae bacterium]|nr:AsmA family protein [Saprospiraceae bacterium]
MLKRFAKIAGIALGLLVLLSVLLTEIFEKKIGNTIVQEVQAQLTSDLQIDNFDLSLLRSFPRVSANLEGVVVEDAGGEVLLECKTLAFRFGLFSLFSSNIKVRSVVISDGALRVSIDKKGKPNYDIFKKSETEEPEVEEPSELSISLAKATLENIELIYEDESADQSILLQVEEATFSGEVSSTKFELETTAQLHSNFIETGTSRYLAGKKLGYDAKLLVDLDEGLYEFTDVLLEVDGNVFRIEGHIDEEPGFTEVDLAATIEEGNLEAIVQLLPADYLDYAGGLSSKGTFFFNATAQGRYNDRTMPAIQVDFGLKDGRVNSDRIDGSLKDVNFDASFTNGDKHTNATSHFVLNDFRAYLDKERVEMQLDVRNLDDPQIEFYLDGTLPLRSTYGLFGEQVTGGEGELEINELKVKGRYKDMIQNSRAGRVTMTGSVEFDDTGVTINDETMRFDRGKLLIDNNSLTIQELELEGAGSEIVLNGKFSNLLPVLFADDRNSKDAYLDFDATLTAGEIDIDRFVALTAVPEADTSSRRQQQEVVAQKSETEHREWLASFLEGTFEARVGRYTSGALEGTDFVGQLIFRDRQMQIKGETKTMDGSFTLDGKMMFIEEPILELKLIADHVSMSEFFRQTGNFGQETLTDKQVSGILNSKIWIQAYFDSDGNFLSDKLYVIAGIGLEKGRLRNFELLESFSKYVHIQELRDIEIVSLQNYLEIKGSKLYIPVMFIQSTALNLTISGTHTFDNYLDYNIKVNAGQVVMNRVKKYDPNMVPVTAKRNGWANLYYKIEGPMDSYDFRSAKKEIKQDFAQSEYLKRELRDRLIRHFGDIQLVEEPEAWNDIPEFSGFDENEDDEFLEGDW